MWAPADLFSPLLNIFLLPVKAFVSYLYEHLAVLALAVIAVALLITAVTLINNWRARRT